MDNKYRESRQIIFVADAGTAGKRNCAREKPIDLFVGTPDGGSRPDAALLGLGPRLHAELDEPFLTKADKVVANLPSAEVIKKDWNEVNGKLRDGFAKFSVADWLQKHASVSAEDFAKEPHRNRFAILLSRTNHLSYHLGQAVIRDK